MTKLVNEYCRANRELEIVEAVARNNLIPIATRYLEGLCTSAEFVDAVCMAWFNEYIKMEYIKGDVSHDA
mgnify:CR=1 FL=1